MKLLDQLWKQQKLRLNYVLDVDARVVRIKVNKQERHRTQDDHDIIASLSAHFVSMGMAVIVED
jgi:hypothetical protein